MAEPKEYTDYQKLSFKDIETLLVSISVKMAKQYLTDIKKEYEIKIVLFHHFKQYFKITQIPPKIPNMPH